MRKAGFVSVIVLAALGGCVSPSAPAPAPSPPAPPPPTPTPAPVPPPPAPGEWTDRAATPGDWSYRQDSGGSVAQFGQPGAAPRFAVRCEKAARRIRFERSGVLDPGSSARLTLTSTAGTASYALANIGGSPPNVAASTGASDAFLDKLVYTRGRFLVRADGAEEMVLPGWAEIARVVEDCRG
ncbi:hypothetical protein [Sphingomonas colocasiae]|uniref:Lipoprotein n=1 Tax=Sphingomonas colocasiae TaxID=1848973 RepID=A0ABS7PXG7_9SPHN|nr:hypothetical protein [Sphingomonas colocasiae]MBY8826062.1 hypothetical protein [Sphingomonas colocasiae]